MLNLCHNPSLGITTKARVCKGAGQEEAQESHLMFLGVKENVREQTLTFPSELPFMELEYGWTPKSSENNCKDKNPLD
jgi:hypothetical protein